MTSSGVALSQTPTRGRSQLGKRTGQSARWGRGPQLTSEGRAGRPRRLGELKPEGVAGRHNGSRTGAALGGAGKRATGDSCSQRARSLSPVKGCRLSGLVPTRPLSEAFEKHGHTAFSAKLMVVCRSQKKIIKYTSIFSILLQTSCSWVRRQPKIAGPQNTRCFVCSLAPSSARASTPRGLCSPGSELCAAKGLRQRIHPELLDH